MKSLRFTEYEGLILKISVFDPQPPRVSALCLLGYRSEGTAACIVIGYSRGCGGLRAAFSHPSGVVHSLWVKQGQLHDKNVCKLD